MVKVSYMEIYMEKIRDLLARTFLSLSFHSIKHLGLIPLVYLFG